MVTRTRLRESATSGQRTHKNTGAISFRSYISSEYVEEEVATGDNYPFLVNKVHLSGGLISGEEKSHLTGYTWEGYPCVYMSDGYVNSHIPLPSLSYGDFAIDLLKRTNPSRSSFESLVSLYELREVPGMGKEALGQATGRLFKHIPERAFRLLSRAAKLNLMVQFGIMPILGDIEKLLGFQKLVDQRVNEINKLYGEKGLRRTIDLYSDSAIDSDPSATIQSEGVLLHAAIDKVTTRSIRGHARWYVSSPPIRDASAIRAKAGEIISGYQFDLTTLYEAMPWSWLVDYFVNIGDFVENSRNMLDAHHDTPRIIEHTRTEIRSRNHDIYQEWDGSIPYTVTCSQILNTVETKRRFPANVSLSAQTEFLTGKQLSILGSLAVLGVR
nr:MAG: hypothetical protein 1 [Leviviridae sp.]